MQLMGNTFEMAKMNIRVNGKNFEDMDANEQLGVFSVGAERAEGELARRAKYSKLSRGSSPSFKFRTYQYFAMPHQLPTITRHHT